jgi:hypothetical protein
MYRQKWICGPAIYIIPCISYIFNFLDELSKIGKYTSMIDDITDACYIQIFLGTSRKAIELEYI